MDATVVLLVGVWALTTFCAGCLTWALGDGFIRGARTAATICFFGALIIAIFAWVGR